MDDLNFSCSLHITNAMLGHSIMAEPFWPTQYVIFLPVYPFLKLSVFKSQRLNVHSMQSVIFRSSYMKERWLVGCPKMCKSVNLLIIFHTQLCLYLKLTQKKLRLLRHFWGAATTFKIRPILQRKLPKNDPLFAYFFVLAVTFHRMHLFQNRFHQWSTFWPYFT